MKPEEGISGERKETRPKKAKGGGEDSGGEVYIRIKYNATCVWKCRGEANYFVCKLKNEKKYILLFFPIGGMLRKQRTIK